MIKGIQIRTVVLRTPGNPYFEEAHFMLRSDYRRGGAETDLLAAANRILDECGAENHPMRRRKRRCGGGVFFALGALLGGAIATVIFLLIFL